MEDRLTREEISARQDEIKDRLKAIDEENRGVEFSGEVETEWNGLNEEFDRLATLDEQLATRERVIAERFGEKAEGLERGAHFQTPRPGVARGDDIYDLTTVRELDPRRQKDELRDRAMRSVEKARFAHPDAEPDEQRAHIEGLMDRVQCPKADPGNFSRYLLQVGNPVYERAFEKIIDAAKSGLAPMLSVEEQRAASVGTGSAGGFAVPYTLDPTIIKTGNWSVNPWRSISRVETISGSNEWRGVSSGDLTATRRAEAAEVADNMTTLSQPTVVVSRVDAFVPFSYEIDQDWGSFRSEIAMLFSQAKDNEEATAFATGNGTAPNPQGVITGATNVYTTAGTAAFVVADLYGTKNALPPRFRPNAKYVAEQSTYDLIRQFDTQGGASLFIDNLKLATSQDQVPTQGSIAASVLGKPAYEASAMASGLTSGNLILIYGDFRYYLIVDRVGMSVEVIQNLFATPNNFPSGQRGLLAFWRNNAKVLSAAAFRVTKTK